VKNLERSPTPLWKLWGLAFACFFPFAILSIFFSYLGARSNGQEWALQFTLQIVTDWSLWVFLTPLIVWVARQFPVQDGNRIRGVSVLVLFGLLIALVDLALFTAISRYFIGDPADSSFATYRASLLAVVTFWYPYALLVYAVIAVATQAVEAARRSRFQEVEAAELREQLTEAQLQALRMQLHPHFLGNTLNTIAGFVERDRTREASDLLASLGELLTRSLEAMTEQEVPLRQELDFLQNYLDIEELRFSDRLSVSIEASEELLEAAVPYMILQPLVENAMRHGVGRSVGPARLDVSATSDGKSLCLTVSDDGPGLSSNEERWGRDGGVGLENTARRLEVLYGRDARLEVRDREEGGVESVVLMPLRLQSVAYRRDERVSAVSAAANGASDSP